MKVLKRTFYHWTNDEVAYLADEPVGLGDLLQAFLDSGVVQALGRPIPLVVTVPDLAFNSTL